MKHRVHRLVLDPERQKLPDCFEELQESAKNAFGDIAFKMIETNVATVKLQRTK